MRKKKEKFRLRGWDIEATSALKIPCVKTKTLLQVSTSNQINIQESYQESVTNSDLRNIIQVRITSREGGSTSLTLTSLLLLLLVVSSSISTGGS